MNVKGKGTVEAHKLKNKIISNLTLVFILTGLIAIVFQQIFEKALGAVIGTSLVSASTVLGIFFTGIAIGSISYKEILKKIKNPVTVFVLSESFVGVWGIFVYFLFDMLNFWSHSIMRFWGAGGIGFTIGSILITGIWVLPFTVAMGFSFPAMVGILEMLGLKNINLHISRFYSFNLLGATIGALVGIYWLFPSIGLIQTLIVMSLVEVAIAMFVLFYANKILLRVSTFNLMDENEKKGALKKKISFSSSFWILLLISFFSGFIVFGFEVIWNHLIGATLGTSVYSFANMLFAVLLGLFMASLINSQVFSKLPVIPNYFILIVIQAAAVSLCLSFLYWDNIPNILMNLGLNISTLQVSPFLFGEFVRIKYCVILITLPSIFLGMVYPFLFRSKWFPASKSDQTVAWMSAINAIGSISGAFLTIFVFIPLFGSEKSFKWLVVLFSLTALICFVKESTMNGSAKILKIIEGTIQFGALGLCLFITTSANWNLKELTSGKNVYFSEMHVSEQSKLIFFKEGIIDGFVTVVSNAGTNVLLTNGKFQGNDAGEIPAQISFALLPILHLSKTEKAAVIGLGTGQSAAVIKAAGFSGTDIMELSPGIVEAAGTCFSHSNKEVLNSNGVDVHIADGRTYLLLSDTIYDLISIEVSSIWFSGSTNIYSKEFYEIAKSRLTLKGVLQQWIQFHHIGTDEILSSIATIRAVFPYVSVWLSGGQGILLASKSPLELNQQMISEIPKRHEMKYFLNILKKYNVESSKILEMTDVDRLAQDIKSKGIPINTDKNRYLEFHTPRYNLERIDHSKINLEKLISYKNK